ncbi:hypothetical protein SUGI_0647290 [Cryptomeria japonica]|uniref:dirigent protein 1-like n=1 Tax=Cryptomeria japonica TaxID=3369 RepID=UPI002414A271|nr:dirigent protein 1-like [Cryptomeria japonica]GLJ32150.1 hypothetical protein SUGI_0647290 [Cryptomeria japonica]
MASQMLYFIVLSLAILSCSWGYQQEENIVFYLRDIVSKPNATAIVVAGANGSTSIQNLDFGSVVVIDDFLTEMPGPSSTVVGRAKGFYAYSDVDANAVHMVFSLVFQNRKYNGSTLEFHGTLDILTRSSGSEVSVVGGTGKLRYARGYSILTFQSDIGLDSIVEFNTSFRLD